MSDLRVISLLSIQPLLYSILLMVYAKSLNWINTVESILIGIPVFFIYWILNKRRLVAKLGVQYSKSNPSVSKRAKRQFRIALWSALTIQFVLPILILGLYVIIRDHGLFQKFIFTNSFKLLTLILLGIYYPLLLFCAKLLNSWMFIAFFLISAGIAVFTLLGYVENPFWAKYLATTALVATGLGYLHDKIQENDNAFKTKWNAFVRFMSWGRIDLDNHVETTQDSETDD